MKKIFTLIVCLLLFTGCTNKKIKENTKVKEEPTKEKKEIYIDNNNMPISFYEKNKKITTKSVVLKVGHDLGIFQIFPSNDEEIKINNSYKNSFDVEWNKYDLNNKTKLGYNISYSLDDGRKISHTILNPSNTMDYEGYMAVYLYDDYSNGGKSWYSHVEEKDYNENTFLTSIKLYGNSLIESITSNIIITAFTYDTEDDFDPVTKEYRGNSKATLVLTK